MEDSKWETKANIKQVNKGDSIDLATGVSIRWDKKNMEDLR